MKTRIANAIAKVEHARALLDEALRELAAANLSATKRRGSRPIVRPPGESDELSAKRARRILRDAGFVPRKKP